MIIYERKTRKKLQEKIGLNFENNSEETVLATILKKEDKKL